MIRQLIQSLKGHSRRRNRRSGIHAVEVCEDRRLLTNFLVNSLADTEASDGELTLREAIAAANTNSPVHDAPAGGAVDTIEFHQALFGQQITLESGLSIAGNLTITGGDQPGERITISGADAHQIFQVTQSGEVTFRSIDLTNGRAITGGAIQNHGDVLLDNVVITDSHATTRGGAVLNAGTMAVAGSTLSGNSSNGDGGAIYSEGLLDVRESKFSDNNSGDGGGAIFALDALRIASSELFENTSAESGGAILAQSQLLMDSSSVHTNIAVETGGGIVTVGADSVISNSTIAYNTADSFGGGIAVGAGGLSILQTTIAHNQAGSLTQQGQFGGGISAGQRVLIGSSLVVGNFSGSGANRRADDLLTDGNGSFGVSYSVISDPNSASGAEAANSNTVGNNEGGVLDADLVLSRNPDPQAAMFILPLVADSPAIDHGKSNQALDSNFNPLSFDQRGEPHARIVLGQDDGFAEPDAGAYEFHPFGPIIERIDTAQFDSTATVYWQSGADVIQQELVVENLSSGQTGDNAFFIDRNVVGNALELNDLPDGRYRVWLRGENDAGQTSNWSVRTFSKASIPFLHQPVYNAATRRMEYSWHASPDTVRAEFWVVNRSLQTAPNVFQVDAVAGQNVDSTFAASVGRNDAWVRTQNSSGVWSKWSNAARLDVRPQLTSPAGGLFDRRPEFRWEGLNGVDSWEIWIQSGPDVIHVSDIEQTSFRPDADLAPGLYRWWVRAHHEHGASQWSDVMTFNTAGRTTVLPQGPLVRETPLVTIRYAEVPEAASYELYIRHRQSGDVVLHQNVGNVTEYRVPLVNRNYEVWARAIAADGSRGSWSDRVLYEANSKVLSEASVELDDQPNTLDNRPTIRWQGQDGAVSFSAVLWHKESQLEQSIQLAGAGNWIPPNELAEGEWQLFVRAYDAEGEGGGWQESNRFYVGGRTQLISPDVAVADARPSISWREVEGAASYLLVVVDSNRNEVFRNNAVAAELTELRPDADFAVGSYRAWIRITKPDGTFGPWSDRFDFEVV